MQRHKNMFPAKEQAKIPEKELNETEFKTLVYKDAQSTQEKNR